MRVLVTSTPGTGHVFPILPLATALRDCGHVMLWATAEDGTDLVRQYGFDTAVAGMNLHERRATLASRLPEIARLDPRARRGELFAGYFARGAAPKTVKELGPIFERFQPDLVIHEPNELAAAPHAVSRAIPHVTVPFSGVLPPESIAMAEQSVAPVWAELGLPPPTMSDMAGSLYLHPFPPSMGQAPTIPQVRPMRAVDVPAGPPSETPAWLEGFGCDRPGIYVTNGTTPVVAQMAPWKASMEAFASMDADVLATIGSQLPISELGAVPPNVRVERFVPQRDVLGRVGVVMSHAGAGTMLAAARVGVPQLLIPTWADQWENADAIASTGAGIVLEEHQRDSEVIAAALQHLLDEELYSVAASDVATEIAAMPTPETYVAELQQLADSSGRSG